MSAWTIGCYAPAAAEDPATINASQPGILALGANENRLSTFVDRLTRWIPGEILIFYAAGITILSEGNPPRTGFTFLTVTAIATLAVIAAARFAKEQPFDRFFWASAIIGLLSFVVWSMTVPGSAWQGLSFFKDHPGMTTPVAAIGAVILGQIADGIISRLKRS